MVVGCVCDSESGTGEGIPGGSFGSLGPTCPFRYADRYQLLVPTHPRCQVKALIIPQLGLVGPCSGTQSPPFSQEPGSSEIPPLFSSHQENPARKQDFLLTHVEGTPVD